MPFNALAKEINQIARDHGFWDKDRDMGEMLMLAISEVAEALEEDRDGNPPIWYKHENGCLNYMATPPTVPCSKCTSKPEGAVIELADCAIRCCDTLYSYDEVSPLDISEYVTHERLIRHNTNTKLPVNFGDACFEICRVICMARDTALPLTRVIVLCEELCATLGYDLVAAMKEKMRYNAGRPYMHGKAY